MLHLLALAGDPGTRRRIETPYFFATDRDVNNAPVRPRVPAAEVSQSGGAPPTVTATMRMTTKIPMRRPSASNLSRRLARRPTMIAEPAGRTPLSPGPGLSSSLAYPTVAPTTAMTTATPRSGGPYRSATYPKTAASPTVAVMPSQMGQGAKLLANKSDVFA